MSMCNDGTMTGVVGVQEAIDKVNYLKAQCVRRDEVIKDREDQIKRLKAYMNRPLCPDCRHHGFKSERCKGCHAPTWTGWEMK